MITEQQASELIELEKKNTALLSEIAELLKRQISLFEQYDAESLFEDEEIREQILRQRSGRT